MLGLAGSAMASTITSTNLGVKPVGNYSYTPPVGPRQGGDVIGSATPIGSLPYTDTGTTVGYVNDYDEVCPYTGSVSPDVVYSYHATETGCMDVSLCYSSYDTKVYVYENAQGNLVACNDDYYSSAPCYTYSSGVFGVVLNAGSTYYIVVDGYNGASGPYQIDVIACVPPEEFVCPDGAMHENEPACQDNYNDNWNGGCNSTPTIWQEVPGQNGTTCATMCGYSCTYISSSGLSTRDTDWFTSTGTGTTVTVTSVAEFALQSILIYGTDCANISYVIATSGAGVPNTLSYYVAAGSPVWTWEGAQTFSGVPNLQYKFEICGITPGEVPTQTTSWGSLKNQYR